MSNPRWKRRPHGSTWGDWGPDDQLGRLNLLTPEKVKQGVAEVKDGLSFCLSLPLDYPGGNLLNPRRHPPVIKPTERSRQPNMNYALFCDDPNLTDVVCDDVVILTLQYSTQWDSLSHVGQMFDADGDGKPEAVYYNGYRAGIDILGPAEMPKEPDTGNPHGQSTSRATKLGVENMAAKAIQGRGVLIDLHAHFGRERKLVGYDDLMRVMEKDNVVVESGDMALFHTGFAAMLLEMERNPDKDKLHGACSVLNGRDQKLLKWITDSGVVSMIADNYAVEAHPAEPGEGCCSMLPLHEHCLFKLGVNLGEIWYLTELADYLRKNKRNRFLLTAPPLRLPGAVGSPATPVATV